MNVLFPQCENCGETLQSDPPGVISMHVCGSLGPARLTMEEDGAVIARVADLRDVAEAALHILRLHAPDWIDRLAARRELIRRRLFPASLAPFLRAG